MANPSANVLRMKSSSIHSPCPSSPARLGYRLPAEWEPHESTWVCWPHRESTWSSGLGAVGKFYASIVGAIAEDECVRIGVLDAEMEIRARAVLAANHVKTERVQFHHCVTDDAWIRSYAPMILHVPRSQVGYPERLAVDWRFNGWGDRQESHRRDNSMSRRVASTLRIPTVSGGMVLEGGSVEVNGQGALLATRSSVLNANRNPDLSRDHIEQRLKEMLGIDQLLWLDSVPLVGDETDGHIDNVARFTDERTVVASVESNVSDPNYVALQINLERLRSMRLRDGRPLDIRALPMPPAIYRGSRRMPASYTQFYLSNQSVLVPQFGADSDPVARDILGRCFPERRVVGIHSRDILQSKGGLHHLTRQIPA